VRRVGGVGYRLRGRLDQDVGRPAARVAARTGAYSTATGAEMES
jgi:hypothetical protein